MDTNNPLTKYFRKPGIHTGLPSGGRFFAEGEVEFSANNEVAVLPMTAADEIVVKNPDMLLNGEALEHLFLSCVPAIKNPRKISIPDMDVLLLAIKLSSYGDDLTVGAECPKCKNKVEPVLSIREILSTVTALPDNTDVRLGDELVIRVKPHDFESKTILDMAAFEERQMFKHLLGNDEISDRDRGKLFNESFNKFANLNLDLIAKCVMSVITPDGEVTKPEFIKEFIVNLDKDSVKKITKMVETLGESGMKKEITITCPAEECNHQWQSALIFDPTSFFD
jgi:hypothetical protein